jgi:hypothetical protein
MKIIPMNIGLRTIKTALVVSISIFLSQLLNLEYPYFVAIMVHISSDISPFFFGLHLTLDSLFGPLIAFVVNISVMLGYLVKRLNEHLSKLMTFELPLKKFELYLSSNEEELKLVLKNNFSQTL